jgi:hypothetical protein
VVFVEAVEIIVAPIKATKSTFEKSMNNFIACTYSPNKARLGLRRDPQSTRVGQGVPRKYGKEIV